MLWLGSVALNTPGLRCQGCSLLSTQNNMSTVVQCQIQFALMQPQRVNERLDLRLFVKCRNSNHFILCSKLGWIPGHETQSKSCCYSRRIAKNWKAASWFSFPTGLELWKPLKKILQTGDIESLDRCGQQHGYHSRVDQKYTKTPKK